MKRITIEFRIEADEAEVFIKAMHPEMENSTDNWSLEWYVRDHIITNLPAPFKHCRVFVDYPEIERVWEETWED